MRNRFNLNEEEKKHIRGLHGIKQSISEQYSGPGIPYTVTYQPGDDAKYTRQEWVDGYKNAHKYLAGLLNGKTLNLYEKVGNEEGEVLTWKDGPLKINIGTHDLQLAHYGNHGGDKIPGIQIKVEGEVVDPMFGDTLNTKEFKIMYFCGENYLRASGNDDEKLYWVKDPDDKRGYEGSSSEFMNDDLITLLSKVCDDTTPNPFTEFYDMIMEGREVPEADFSMGDEDTEETLA